MTNICNIQDCKFEKFTVHDECLLHCCKEKILVSSGNIIQEFESLFFTKVCGLILENKIHDEYNLITQDSIRKYLSGDSSNTLINTHIEMTPISISNVSFPSFLQYNETKCFSSLEKITEVSFKNCKFYNNKYPITHHSPIFENCYFYNKWEISQRKGTENNKKIRYSFCTFQADVICSSEDPDEHGIFSVPLFEDCNFTKELFLSNTDFENQIFKNSNNSKLTLNQLKINGCKIKSKFILNKINFENVTIEDSYFDEKFEFKSNSVNYFQLTNTNFKKIFDAYESNFTEFKSYKNIHENFVGFEKCTFGKGKNGTQTSSFVYVTFLSFTNFRNAYFSSGLDLQNTNLKEPPNFLNIRTNFNSTNRETYRIIKNSFDKTGNHIEANKFFVLEMNKYKEELSGERCSQEKIIFYMNSWISNFGGSFVRPIVWIVLTSFIYWLLVQGFENNILYRIYPPYNEYIYSFTNTLNKIASNVIPFSKFLTKEMEFISLIFYAIFASLIWQVIVAVKRHTQR